MSWSHGYYTDLTYTRGYHREMSPAMLRLACLSARIRSNIPDNPTYLEIGFGQGYSINVHAVASEGRYFGNDFNPSHVVEARRMAQASGADLTLLDDSFAELSQRTDLPDFDIIALHGVWSWISEANRQAIVGILRRKLKPGGIAYISYNCMPGWATVTPVRDLLMLHAKHGLGQAADPRSAVAGATEFARNVVAAGPVLARENPFAAHKASRLDSRDPSYVAHEYMNADWHLLNFSQMAESLEEAKLTFVGSARLLDRLDGLNLTPDGRKLIAGIGNGTLQETVRDYLRNARFRADVFVKGPTRLSSCESRDAWHGQTFALIKSRDEVPQKIPCALGEADLPQDLHGPLADALADRNYAPKSLTDLLDDPRINDFTPEKVVEGLLVLVGAGVVSPAQRASVDVMARCEALNRHVLDQALDSPDFRYMASSVTGGGILVPHMVQMFMKAETEGGMTAEDLASFVWRFLDGIGERIIKDGVRLESRKENLVQLHVAASHYISQTRPLLQALGIIPPRT